MNTSTAKNSSSTLRIAVAVLAGAVLSGCAGAPYDPYLDTPLNRQGYNQPYPSQRYYDTNAQGNYYNPNRPYYTDGPYYYQPR
jgi:hypothetical protein